MYKLFKNQLFGECTHFLSELMIFRSKGFSGVKNLSKYPFKKGFTLKLYVIKKRNINLK